MSAASKARVQDVSEALEEDPVMALPEPQFRRALEEKLERAASDPELDRFARVTARRWKLGGGACHETLDEEERRDLDDELTEELEAIRAGGETIAHEDVMRQLHETERKALAAR